MCILSLEKLTLLQTNLLESFNASLTFISPSLVFSSTPISAEMSVCVYV